MASHELLPWDSKFFGLTIGRLLGSVDDDRLAEAVAEADTEAVRCLYLLCPADNHTRLEAAIDAGFRPYDVRIELDSRLGHAGREPTGVRLATAEDEPALDRIARKRMTGTRFWNDPRFPRDRVEDLYSAWLHRGMSTPPDRLTIATDRGEGFVICHFDRAARVGTIELIGVAATVERRGLGSELVRAAERAFTEAGMSRATVVTQASNIAAQRLYQRYGYRTRRADVWLHRWASS